MAWVLTDKEYQAVIKMAAPERYEYLIKKIADNEDIWSLASDDGWVMLGDGEGHECIPVWPHSRYAEVCAVGSWLTANPQPIKLDEWLDRWLPGLENDSRLVAVFPTPVMNAAVISPTQMKNDLLEELENYE